MLVYPLRGGVGVYHSPNPQKRRCHEADYHEHQHQGKAIECHEQYPFPDFTIVDLAETSEQERKDRRDCRILVELGYLFWHDASHRKKEMSIVQVAGRTRQRLTRVPSATQKDTRHRPAFIALLSL